MLTYDGHVFLQHNEINSMCTIFTFNLLPKNVFLDKI